MEGAQEVKELQSLVKKQEKAIRVLINQMGKTNLNQGLSGDDDIATHEQPSTKPQGQPLDILVTQKRPLLKDLFESLDQFVKHEQGIGKNRPIGLNSPVPENILTNSRSQASNGCSTHPSHIDLQASHGTSKSPSPFNEDLPSQWSDRSILASPNQQCGNRSNDTVRKTAQPP